MKDDNCAIQVSRSFEVTFIQPNHFVSIAKKGGGLIRKEHEYYINIKKTAGHRVGENPVFSSIVKMFTDSPIFSG